MDLTEAENIKKEVARTHRKTVQKYLNDSDNHDHVVTRPEPSILELKASGS